MPTRKQKQPKPTRQESKAASELQAPPNTGKFSKPDEKKNLFKSARSLAQSGVSLDDGKSREYFHPEDFFENKDDDTSKAFVVTNAVRIKGKFGPMIRLSVTEEDGSESFVGMSLANKSGDVYEDRQKFIQYFQTNTAPLGPLMFVKLPTEYDKPYIVIQDAVPF